MPQGHPDYRFIAQEMWRKIQEVHPALAEVGRFIDWKSYRLGRLSRRCGRSIKMVKVCFRVRFRCKSYF